MKFMYIPTRRDGDDCEVEGGKRYLKAGGHQVHINIYSWGEWREHE